MIKQLTDRQKLMMEGKVCPYCNRDSDFVDSAVVYGRSFGMVYYCQPCQAWCGVHKGSNVALGRLAKADLREAKREAHKYFDKIFKRDIMDRTEAYTWLSDQLGLPREYTHIGMFSLETCKRATQVTKEFLNRIREIDKINGKRPITRKYEI
jgi:hypothetical protein